MKKVVDLIYIISLSTYYYNQKKDIEKAKETAFIAVRNSLGVFFFMLFVVVSVIIKNVFNLEFRMKDYRILIYLIGLLIVLSYINYSKKYMQPMFNEIELDEKYKGNNIPYISLIVFLGLYAGGMFVIARLIGRLFH